MIIISAMTRDRVIGRRGGLPWSIPDEYEQFLAHVRGQAVIFGRKSYEIFGGDLPDAELFVVSRSADLAGARVFQTCVRYRTERLGGDAQRDGRDGSVGGTR